MSTSNSHLFASPQSKDLIEDAYERCGILPSDITAQKIFAAQRSMNFILQSWINRGLKLWTVKSAMLYLNNNQNQYNLPLYTSDILEATIRTSVQNLNGSAFSSAGGDADNAFLGNPLLSCAQNAPDGYISYNWGVNNNFTISMVGVLAFEDSDYTLDFEYLNVDNNWIGVNGTPVLTTYLAGVISWYAVISPVSSTQFRVRETGGATLNISGLFFNSSVYDTIITRISRSEYIALSNKGTPTLARPSSFYVDRQINPVLYIWPTPYQYYNNLFYTYVQQIEDIGTMVNSAAIPARFLEALCAELALKLGIKEKLDSDKIQILQGLAKEEFNIAQEEDRERVPLRIYGDYMQGWAQS